MATATSDRPPSVDNLARRIGAAVALPHPLCVEVARECIAVGPEQWADAAAISRADQLRRTLLTPVINATGVLLHTNLGRAPLAFDHPARALTVEFDLASGERGSRQQAVGQLFARLCGAESAMVVNNNAAAVLLVLAAVARGRDVAVSRGESVEIGGSFRVPEVMEQSGCRLVDVGTTNRTRLSDYARSLEQPGRDVAMILKVHPSNYRIDGFVESTAIRELATLGTPVVADIGSGLLDATCPWLPGAPPAWLADEPAARQAIDDGAALVTFSADKLLGGPQAGIIAGRADLVRACGRHPLARALRPGGHVLAALQDVALRYLDKRAVTLPFWRMVTATLDDLRRRAAVIVDAVPAATVADVESLPGAGTAPGVTIPSVGVAIAGDHLVALRHGAVPIIARTRHDITVLDLRTVDPTDDAVVANAVGKLAST
jgi:L-seryl-tRNA(Ser) seleniumtransferase